MKAGQKRPFLLWFLAVAYGVFNMAIMEDRSFGFTNLIHHFICVIVIIGSGISRNILSGKIVCYVAAIAMAITALVVIILELIFSIRLYRGDWEAVIAIQGGIALVFWSVAKYYNYQIRKLEHSEVVSESEK